VTGSGIVRSDQRGEKSNGTKEKKPPIAPIQIVVCSPTAPPRTPLRALPTGMAPQTMNRIVAFMRPCIRGGVIACR
jgi:hypothetical protein